MYVYIYTYTHTYTNIYTYTYIHTYTHYTYTYIFTNSTIYERNGLYILLTDCNDPKFLDLPKTSFRMLCYVVLRTFKYITVILYYYISTLFKPWYRSAGKSRDCMFLSVKKCPLPS